MAELILHPGKERSLLRRHPWVFDTSIARLQGQARPGDTVTLVTDQGQPLAKAAYSPHSRIRARVWSFDPAMTIDHAFFKRRVAEAVARRQALPELWSQQGLRLLNAEADGLPGVTADRYGDSLVLQLTSAGAEKWRSAIVEALIKSTGCVRLYERSDAEIRAREGMESVTGWRYGTAPEHDIRIQEHSLTLLVNIEQGHKTGYYLDQRNNRTRLAGLVQGKRVLNCFCYTGGFSLQALAGGASQVLSIDSSQPALNLAIANLECNPQLDSTRAEWRCANVFEALRELKNADATFDLIILDPPKFAPSASHADKASRAYKDINLLACKLLSPNGLLMTFSCSGGISLDLFQKIVAGAALDSGRTARIVERLQGSADHPVDLAFPEGEYLKGLLLQVE